MSESTKDILFDLYFGSDTDKIIHKLYEEDRKATDSLIGFYNREKPILDAVKMNSEEKAGKFTMKDRGKILLQEAWFAAYPRTPKKHKVTLLSVAGNSHEDIQRFCESVSLTARLVLPLEATIFAANAAGIHPVLSGIEDPHTMIAVGLAYSINTAATYFNYRKNHEAMHTQELGFSPNILVTYIYMLIKKQFPNNDFIPDLSVALLSTLPIAGPEIFQAGELLIPNSGTTAVFVRNLVGAVGQAIQAGYVQYRLNLIRKNSIQTGE